MSKSKIEWTDKTWNPLAGCTRVSPGCDNCYAASMSLRLEAMALAEPVPARGRQQLWSWQLPDDLVEEYAAWRQRVRP
jgi:protein gp37